MTGTLSILNVYEGDVKITFDKSNPAETIRARRVIKDCIRRGYALLIEIDGAYQRALDFNEEVGEYIVADLDASYMPDPKAARQLAELLPNEELEDAEAEASPEEANPPTNSKRKTGRRAVKMESVNAVAIARSAGG